MSRQLQLFSFGVTPVLDSSKMSRSEFFQRFHRRNPHIYLLLVRLTRQELRENGRRQIPIRLIWEKLRSGFLKYVSTDDGYKLNNNLTRFYARMIMRKERDLAGVFMTRDRDRVERVRKIGHSPAALPRRRAA